MYIEKEENKIYAFLLFLIWPFLSVIIAINEYRQKWAKNLVWFFTAFFAYARVNPSDHYNDAMAYQMKFESFARDGTFHDFINGLYTEGTVDILQPILEYLASRFTDNYQIYFLFIGILYGYFYSRNIWFLLEKATSKLQLYSIIIVAGFALIVPIWNIGGFRFWLATHVFVFGIFKYFSSNHIKGLLIIGSTFLIHFSFLLPIGIFISYLFLGNRINLFFIIFIISIFFSKSGLSENNYNSGYLPTVFQQRVDIYTSENSFKKKASSARGNWYLDFSSRIIKYSSIIFMMVLYWKRKFYINISTWLFSFFSFTLLFYAMANILSGVPSGGRFLKVADLLAFATLFIALQNYNEKFLLKTIYSATPFLLIFFIVSLRKGFDSFGLSIIFGNPFVAVFMEENNPLIDYIKGLIM